MTADLSNPAVYRERRVFLVAAAASEVLTAIEFHQDIGRW